MKIPLFKVFMNQQIITTLPDVLLSGNIAQGPKVVEFENALQDWLGTTQILTVNSGTTGLNLALRLAGVGPGSSVVSSPQTCLATNLPILERGAEPIWADIDPWTGNIDPIDVERKIQPNTKAVIAVDYGGYPCDLDELLEICNRKGIVLIEDAAHAFGAQYKNKTVGSISDYTVFSLQAIKHITTVDGGILTTSKKIDYDRGKLLRWFGIDRDIPQKDIRCDVDVKEWGGKWHMNDINATIGLANLECANTILTAHRENAKFYQNELTNLKNIKLLQFKNDRISSNWLYTFRTNNRESFYDWMLSNGIQVSQVHVRNDIHTVFNKYQVQLPGVDEFAKEQVSIPVGWWVTKDDRKLIIELIKEWDKHVN